MDNNRPRAAQFALNIESVELGKQAVLIHADPQKYLDKRILAITKKRKELAVLALIRIANTDPDKAAQLLDKKWGLMLTKEEHNWESGGLCRRRHGQRQTRSNLDLLESQRTAGWHRRNKL